ncbi:MAG: HD domain-containing protein [Rhodobacterales bacterium]|nr:HD domain-containing protein [Rhodobacterales bacterium]
MEVRDPIHGAIGLDRSETAVADDPWVQRLRNIRQTGFSFLPFPGATHTRYAHSLGVMHLAGQAFDMAYRNWSFERPEARSQFRSAVRIAALCHDLGHPPFSHCMEFAMPALDSLEISWYRRSAHGEQAATHEDYTIAIMEHTSLGDAIRNNFPFDAKHVAGLISSDIRITDGFFRDAGLDHRLLLSQIISSELDVDRLDYLVRDATCTGVKYGQVDVVWLMSNFAAWPKDGQVCLALNSRAVYAFDHFLIARHHMFLMVYFHHTSVIYEEMVRRYINSEQCTWTFPPLREWLHVDEVALTHHLRQATQRSEWARRVVELDPYRRVVERHGTVREADVSRELAILEDAGFDVIAADSIGRLSRYVRFEPKRLRAPAIQVLEQMPGMPVEKVTALSEASRVFQRYADERRISRLYVAPEDVRRARTLLGLPIAS